MTMSINRETRAKLKDAIMTVVLSWRDGDGEDHLTDGLIACLIEQMTDSAVTEWDTALWKAKRKAKRDSRLKQDRRYRGRQ